MKRAKNNLRKEVLIQAAQNAHNEAKIRQQIRLNEARHYLFFQVQKDIDELFNRPDVAKESEKQLDKVLFKPWELK